ncbi:manganese-binding transcriptional regulator MntR [Puniceicoccales bacterium CK1056]|uniref:Transcriptional regulator MntR n=2 Tax=Oceanipulchritudo coccoides TaxID=2706888 RepID=A0A6B2M1W4_9BACT|nr:manganese-binding transcriptional regulator MntR [Oceanipulchritudo coccoides]
MGAIERDEERAKQHERTRRQNALEVTEDYVEAISDLIEERGEAKVTDLARHFGVAHVTVIRTVERLQEQKLVTKAPYKSIKLTRKGAAMAKASRERHQLVQDFLLALGVSEERAQADAEGIEHHVGRETLEAMQRFIESKNRG